MSMSASLRSCIIRHGQSRTGRVWIAVLLSCFTLQAQAQFKLSESFRNQTAPGWVLEGTDNTGNDDSGILTAGQGPLPVNVNDPSGDGWLRLTNRQRQQQGKALYSAGTFDASQGVLAEFDYVSWGGNGADGITMFLYDATRDMSGSRSGGSMGYCGGSGGYMGIGLDEWGGFSASDGYGLQCHPTSGIGNTRAPDRVVIRGPTDAAGNNSFVTNAVMPGGIDVPGATARPQSNRVRIYLVPNGSGAYRVSVLVGVNGAPMQTIVDGYDYPYPAPPRLSVGFSGATGGSNNIHEVRNLAISTPADIVVTKAVVAADSVLVPGGRVRYRITVENGDINPIDAGIQAPSISAADAPSFVDLLPAPLANANWTCTATAGSTCPAASGSGNLDISGGYTLAPGGTLTYTVDADLPATSTCGAVITNIASAQFSDTDSFSDINDTNNTASAPFTVLCPQLTPGKTASESGVPVNTPFQYNLTLSNPGTGASVTAPVLQDAIPAGVTVTAVTAASGWSCSPAGMPLVGAATLTCSRSAILPAGSPVEPVATLSAIKTAAGALTNAVDVVEGDPGCAITPAPAHCHAEAVVGDGSADLSISKTNTPANGSSDLPDDSVTSGSETIYTITVRNDGTQAADNAVVRDSASNGLTCSSAICSATTGGASCPGGGAAPQTLSVTALQSAAGIAIPVLPAGSTTSITMTCRVP